MDAPAIRYESGETLLERLDPRRALHGCTIGELAAKSAAQRLRDGLPALPALGPPIEH